MIETNRLHEFTQKDCGRASIDWKITPDTHTLYLSGTMPEDEMSTPAFESKTLDEPAVMVAKYGCSTHLTAGVANKIKSVRRQPIQGQSFQSEEWCILGCKPNCLGRIAFSVGGIWGPVSGACKGVSVRCLQVTPSEGVVRLTPVMQRQSNGSSRIFGNTDSTWS